MKYLLLIMLIAGVAFGQPSITGVTGDVDHDGSVTIGGTAFGAKSPAAPLVWETFDSYANGNVLETVDPTWVKFYLAENDGLVMSNTQSHSGSLSASADTRNSALNSTWDTNYKVFATPMNTLFVTYWGRVDDFGSPGGIKKIHRLGSTPAAGGEGPYNGVGTSDFGGSGVCSGGYASWSSDDGRTQTEYLSYPDCGDWVRSDHGVVLSTPGGSDGYFLAEYVGYEKQEFTSFTSVHNSGSYDGRSFQMNSIWLGMAIANHGTTYDEVMYIDDVYIDDTRARIELGDNVAYASCTHREIQIPSSWSTTSIAVTVNTGSFSENDAAYFFVIDADGSVSSGSPVIIGEAGGGAPGGGGGVGTTCGTLTAEIP